MIPLPPPSAISRPYRGLSMQDVDVNLHDDRAIRNYLTLHEVYRRTAWLLLRNGADLALVAVLPESDETLFSPVAEARVLAGPGRVIWVEDPSCDVGNATALARAAARNWVEGVEAYAVLGRFEHVNVIWRPAPVVIRVTEVVPPEPAKLLELAARAIDFDEDLPPIELALDAVDIRDLAGSHPADHYLLPCRGSGVDLPGEVAFLDTRPSVHHDWTLIGCERSVQFHRHFYDCEPEQVDFCPRRRAAELDADNLVLTKCCLLERGVEQHGNVVVVPWGSNLDEIRLALRLVTGVGPVVTAPPIGASQIP